MTNNNKTHGRLTAFERVLSLGETKPKTLLKVSFKFYEMNSHSGENKNDFQTYRPSQARDDRVAFRRVNQIGLESICVITKDWLLATSGYLLAKHWMYSHKASTSYRKGSWRTQPINA